MYRNVNKKTNTLTKIMHIQDPVESKQRIGFYKSRGCWLKSKKLHCRFWNFQLTFELKVKFFLIILARGSPQFVKVYQFRDVFPSIASYFLWCREIFWIFVLKIISRFPLNFNNFSSFSQFLNLIFAWSSTILHPPRKFKSILPHFGSVSFPACCCKGSFRVESFKKSTHSSNRSEKITTSQKKRENK